MGEVQSLILVLIAGAAIIAGVLGMLIVPRVLYTNAYTAMFIGALVARLQGAIPIAVVHTDRA